MTIDAFKMEICECLDTYEGATEAVVVVTEVAGTV